MSLKEAEAALRADADMWDRVAQTTGLARTDAQELTLTATELSWAADETPLLATYQEIQQKIAVLLGEATTVFTGLSIALDKVAAAYKANDQAAAKKYQGVWDIRE